MWNQQLSCLSLETWNVKTQSKHVKCIQNHMEAVGACPRERRQFTASLGYTAKMASTFLKDRTSGSFSQGRHICNYCRWFIPHLIKQKSQPGSLCKIRSIHMLCWPWIHFSSSWSLIANVWLISFLMRTRAQAHMCTPTYACPHVCNLWVSVSDTAIMRKWKNTIFRRGWIHRTKLGLLGLPVLDINSLKIRNYQIFLKTGKTR